MTLVGRWFTGFWNWVIGPSFDEDVEKVRLATVRCCGFLPTVGSVAAILSAGNPTVLGVTAVAAAICQALTARSRRTTAQLITPLPQVNGIVIEGEWVGK
jgi:hypothetical protein